MSRKERFTPQEKEQACIDYIEGNRSRSEICRELYISTSTMNIPVRRVLPHENIQMVGLTTTELSNKTSNNWLNGIASCIASCCTLIFCCHIKLYYIDMSSAEDIISKYAFTKFT